MVKNNSTKTIKIHRKNSVHKLRIQLLILLLCGVQCVSHGMEMIENEHNKKLFEIIAYNLLHDDYHAQRALSLINKKCNKVVENNYWPHKKLIEKHIQENENELLPPVTGVRAWNKDFSKCAWVTYGGDAATSKNLQLTLVGKFHSQVLETFALWKDFYFPVFEDNRPFFDKYGRASFYGYGKAQTCDGSYPSFAQYCLDLNGNALRYCCFSYYYTNPDDIHSYWGQSLHILMQYPVLAKAFLQSKQVRIIDCCDKYDRIKEFYTTGITIPENYKFFKKSVGLEQVEEKSGIYECSRYTSYDSLKAEMRKAIDDQYAKQQAEKNNQNVQEK